MGSISSLFLKRGALIAALCFALSGTALPLYAQNTGTVLLAGEIEAIGRIIQTPDVSAAGQREALTRLARLLTLSGNLEGAADAWFRAAAAEPGSRDDMSLLEGIRCLIAMGQLETAEEQVRTILLTGSGQEAQLEARYLGSHIQAFQTGNGAVLATFLQSDEYADRRPSLLYSLWRVTGEAAWKNRLETEYPSSPEARIVRGLPSEQVSGAPTAMWILLPGRDGVVLEEPVTGGAPAVPAQGTAPQVTAVQPAQPDTPPAFVSPAPAPRGMLQTGLFSREENAQAMAARLKNADFAALVTRRRVNGAEYWAVGVPPDENMNETILKLKNAGFESFPVYE
jgi:hypothetical protein